MRGLAKFYIRYGRGNSLSNVARDGLLMAAAASILLSSRGIHASNLFLIVLVLVAAIGMYLLGALDEKYGWWKRELRYTTEEINPYFRELLERVKKIEEEVEREKFKYSNIFA